MLLDNQACITEIDTLFAKLSRIVDRFFASHLVNNLANARRNISAHYDISNEMFMGTFTANPYPHHGDGELETWLYALPPPSSPSDVPCLLLTQ